MATKRKPETTLRTGSADKTDPATAFGAAIAATLKSFSGLNLPTDKLGELQSEYLKSAGDVWNGALQRLQSNEGIDKPTGDRRFAGAEALPPLIVYGGEGAFDREGCRVMGWRELALT